MKCPTEYSELMHKHLDEDITPEEEISLRRHLKECESCHQHFIELEKAIALVKSTSHIQAPADFTLKVMQNLPKEKQAIGISRWLKGHPFLAAAAVFILFMAGSIFSFWTEDQQFSVSKNPNLVVENSTVIVPEGKTVNGDVEVKNGSIRIEGTVEGDVTVINGEQYLASAGHVSGEIEEVNEVFEWLWYHLKKVGKETVGIFETE